MKRHYVFTLLFFLLGSLMFAETLVLGFGVSEEIPLFQQTRQLFTELSREMEQEITFELRSIPLKRSKLYTLQGKIDGDVGRIRESYANETGAVIVNVSILNVPHHCYAKKEIKIGGAASLRSYTVSIVWGNIVTREYLTKYSLDFSYAQSVEELFHLVKIGRIDIAIAAINQIFLLQEPKWQESGIKVLHPPLFWANFYLFLNAKHKALVPDLERALTRLKKRGRIKEIFSMPDM